ncbi:MAG: DivIVA domain-containing protein [Clostridia bacterium]|nr:DivIVA domain-containing protein [Clostridia bacterium]
MQVTIEMIESKEFDFVPQGYKPEQVDEFLDDIIDEMINMQDEIRDLQGKLAAANAAPKAAPVAAEPRATDTNTAAFREILEMAQRVKDETITKAQTEADAIVAKANEQAKAQLGSLMEDKAKLEKQVAALKEAASAYRANFEALLAAQQDAIEKATDLF